jgi:hypothetical protein
MAGGYLVAGRSGPEFQIRVPADLARRVNATKQKQSLLPVLVKLQEARADGRDLITEDADLALESQQALGRQCLLPT